MHDQLPLSDWLKVPPERMSFAAKATTCFLGMVAVGSGLFFLYDVLSEREKRKTEL